MKPLDATPKQGRASSGFAHNHRKAPTYECLTGTINSDNRQSPREEHSMTTNALLSRYDALLSDLDGVVYAGPFAIEGAPEALNRAEEELNVPVIFVTNNASRCGWYSSGT